MKKLRLALAAAVVASFTVLLVHSPAQAYPGLQCFITDVVVEGGEDAEVTITVDPNVSSTFTLTYQGDDRSGGPGTSFTTTFETPEVDEDTQTTVFGTVTQNGNTSPCTGTIFLEGDDDNDGDGDDDGDSDSDDDGDGDSDDDGNGGGGDNGGLLPNTGGERLAWLIIGAMLVLVGGGVVVASRRRDA